MSTTPMYLTTKPNGANARLVARPLALSGNTFVDPNCDQSVMIAYLRYLGVLGTDESLSSVPRDRMEPPPMYGTGFILIISRAQGARRFDVDCWELLPAGEVCALAFGSPLMPEA